MTHGEPHAGNVMRTGAGRVLVDWDTVALAPPERDLWMLVAGGAEAADLYVRATGTQLDDAALDFFRLARDLSDLAEYLNVLRSPHQEDDDSDCGALKALRDGVAAPEALGDAARLARSERPRRIQTNILTSSTQVSPRPKRVDARSLD